MQARSMRPGTRPPPRSRPRGGRQRASRRDFGERPWDTDGGERGSVRGHEESRSRRLSGRDVASVTERNRSARAHIKRAPRSDAKHVRQDGEKRAGRVAWWSHPARRWMELRRCAARHADGRGEPFDRLTGRKGGPCLGEQDHSIVRDVRRIAIVARGWFPVRPGSGDRA